MERQPRVSVSYQNFGQSGSRVSYISRCVMSPSSPTTPTFPPTSMMPTGTISSRISPNPHSSYPTPSLPPKIAAASPSPTICKGPGAFSGCKLIGKPICTGGGARIATRIAESDGPGGEMKLPRPRVEGNCESRRLFLPIHSPDARAPSSSPSRRSPTLIAHPSTAASPGTLVLPQRRSIRRAPAIADTPPAPVNLLHPSVVPRGGIREGGRNTEADVAPPRYAYASRVDDHPTSETSRGAQNHPREPIVISRNLIQPPSSPRWSLAPSPSEFGRMGGKAPVVLSSYLPAASSPTSAGGVPPSPHSNRIHKIVPGATVNPSHRVIYTRNAVERPAANTTTKVVRPDRGRVQDSPCRLRWRCPDHVPSGDVQASSTPIPIVGHEPRPDHHVPAPLPTRAPRCSIAIPPAQSPPASTPSNSGGFTPAGVTPSNSGGGSFTSAVSPFYGSPVSAKSTHAINHVSGGALPFFWPGAPFGGQPFQLVRHAPHPQRPSVPLSLELSADEKIKFSDLHFFDSLGCGEFGQVYRGKWKGLDVAIKRLYWDETSANVVPDFEKEISSLRHLHHPRLVKFYGACVELPNLCLVTEYMPGGSLHMLLHGHKQPPSMSAESRLEMCIQLAEGVAYLHTHSPVVVHRDLKSLNVVLDATTRNLKICDFGLTESMERTHITKKNNTAGGSPRYMAPELFESQAKVNEKIDVWAMGCIFIELFGGPLPYAGVDSLLQLTRLMLVDRCIPYIPPTCPRPLQRIIRACLLFDPKVRPSSQQVLASLQSLRPCIAELTSSSREIADVSVEGSPINCTSSREANN